MNKKVHARCILMLTACELMGIPVLTAAMKLTQPTKELNTMDNSKTSYWGITNAKGEVIFEGSLTQCQGMLAELFPDMTHKEALDQGIRVNRIR
jgi:hypothetical protein